MTLSVLCPTRDPGPRVRELLSQLRPAADEIVVAADASVGPAELAEYSLVADKLLRFEPGPANSSIQWLHSQCSGDWVLTIAGDEVASRQLVERLPALTRTRSVLQYWLPVRWLFPGPKRWLRDTPWFPDFHNRLVRNDGALWFPGRKHTDATPAYPARYLELPLYHLNLILLDRRWRRAKVAQNAVEQPGLTAAGGLPLDEAYYLPELNRRRSEAAVPPADLEAISAVLGARPEAAGEAPEPPLATRAEIETLWAGRRPGAGAYRATVELLEDEPRMRPGERRALHVRVRNEGDEVWPWGPDQPPPIRMGYRILAPGGVLETGPLAAFPCSVSPGDGCVLPVPVIAPLEEGRFTLELDVVHDGERRFGCDLRVDLEVAAAGRRRRAGVRSLFGRKRG